MKTKSKTKKCSVCGKTKSRDKFPKKGAQCKACVSKYQREYRQQNKTRHYQTCAMSRVHYIEKNKDSTSVQHRK